MTRPCDACGRPYEALRRSARWCSERCRSRARRRGTAAAGEARRRALRPGEVTRALERELAASGQLNSWLGRLAVLLAMQIDNAGDDAHGLVAVGKEFRAVLAELARNGPPTADVIDELRVRRDRRQGWQK